ncbi:MAG: type III-A CRISPR-associated RAMP protein Csm5 [Tissierellia bacterium]|nr:type III-A CRISPR-associated RAMP protein Csm5 [Tissierellia bacterium]
MKGIKGYKTYSMKLKIISPTFISGGEDSRINRSQYIYDSSNNLLKIVDERKLAKFLGKRNLLGLYYDYVTGLNDNTIEEENKNENSINLGQWYNSISSTEKFNGDIDECIKYTIDVSNIKKNQLNDVVCFIKNIQGQPYIPGSSIKGSITNALLVNYIYKNRNKYIDYWEEIKRESNNKKISKWNIKNIEGRLIKEIFDYSIEGKRGKKHLYRGMSGLSISDTSSFDRQGMKLFQRKDVTLTDEYDNLLPIFRECLVSPAEGTFKLSLDTSKLNPNLGLESIEEIYEALQTQFELLLGKDGVFRAFYNLDEYISFDAHAKGNIFIGGGTGYLAKTIMLALAPDKDELLKVVRNLIHRDWPVILIHKNDRIISPRTLKVSNDEGKDILNGVCRIEVAENA